MPKGLMERWFLPHLCRGLPMCLGETKDIKNPTQNSLQCKTLTFAASAPLVPKVSEPWFFICMSVCQAWGQGRVALRGVGSSKSCLRGLSWWMGEFSWGSGLCSWGCFCVLSTDWFHVKMQKLPRKQKAMLPLPAVPPGCVCKSPSPLSVLLLPDRSLLALLILQHSVMVSTGGGDSPLLIHAGLSLLVVGLFFRRESSVGLALPTWWKAENMGLLFVRWALKNLLVVWPLGEHCLC